MLETEVYRIWSLQIINSNISMTMSLQNINKKIILYNLVAGINVCFGTSGYIADVKMKFKKGT